MKHKILLKVFNTAFLLSAVSASASEPPDTDQHWTELFDLETESVGELSVMHSGSLERDWMALREELEALLQLREEMLPMREKLDELKPLLLQEVEVWIGEGGLSPSERDEIFSFFMESDGRFLPISTTSLVFLPQDEIKERLREGYELPSFTYDPENDEVSYEINSSRSSSDFLEEEERILPLPVDPVAGRHRDLLEILLVGDPRSYSMLGLALHEVIEAHLVARLKPGHPQFRWFSDGAAEAIAYLMVEEHFGEEAAMEFDQFRESEKYEDFIGPSNLLYWLPANWEIHVPLKSEEMLTQARYALARKEVLRLIDDHGRDVVRRIIDATEAGSNDPESIMNAVEKVTGTDVRVRLRRYDAFENPENGFQLYRERLNEELSAGNHEEALRALLRSHELLLWTQDGPQLGNYLVASSLLRSMGDTEAATGVFEEFIEKTNEEQRTGMREALIVEAWRMRMPLIVSPVAQVLLNENSRNIAGLSVLLAARMQEGQLNQAKAVAEAILKHDSGDRGDFFTNLATDLLSQIESRMEEF